MRKHAIIAGTGRAGTSFLVDFLRSVGVPTSGVADEVEHRVARAGLEQNLLESESYLVKDPWLHEYIDRIDLEKIEIEALIVPLRDLTDAASSRVRIERAALLQSSVGRASWSSTGSTPGGVLASLSVADQEKILAVGLARLLQWAVSNKLPLYLLDYPRIVEEPDYLVSSLSPWLDQFAPQDELISVARQKFASRAWKSDSQKRDEFLPSEVALNLEIQLEAAQLVINDQLTSLSAAVQQTQTLTHENHAIQQQTQTLTHENHALQQQTQTLTHENHALQQQTQTLTHENHALQQQTQTLTHENHALQQQTQTLTHENHALQQQTQTLTHENHALQQQTQTLTHSCQALTNEVDAVRRSKSYRIGSFLTAPWRLTMRRAKSN